MVLGADNEEEVQKILSNIPKGDLIKMAELNFDRIAAGFTIGLVKTLADAVHDKKVSDSEAVYGLCDSFLDLYITRLAKRISSPTDREKSAINQLHTVFADSLQEDIDEHDNGYPYSYYAVNLIYGASVAASLIGKEFMSQGAVADATERLSKDMFYLTVMVAPLFRQKIFDKGEEGAEDQFRLGYTVASTAIKIIKGFKNSQVQVDIALGKKPKQESKAKPTVFIKPKTNSTIH